MGLIERYLFRQTLMGMLLTLGTLTTLIWLTQVLQQLDLLTVKGQSVGIFVMITVMLLPSFISIMMPISLFISTVFTLNRLNSDSELVVINAAGASRWRVISPFLFLALLVSIIVATINFEIVPRATSAVRILISQIQTDLISNVLREGTFTNTGEKIVFHVRERTANGELLGLLVHDASNPEEEITFLAQRGRLIEENGRNFLIMENGTIQRNSGLAQQLQIVDFERYVFDLSQLRRNDRTSQINQRERTTAFLMNPNPEDPVFKGHPEKFRRELHSRFSSTLYPFLTVMIALATVGFARTTRQNRNAGIILAISIAFSARLIGFSLDNLAGSSDVGVMLVYVFPIVVTLLAGFVAFGIIRPANVPWISRTGEAIVRILDAYWAFILRLISRLQRIGIEGKSN